MKFTGKSLSLSRRFIFSILSACVSLLLLFAAQSSSTFSNWYSEHIYKMLVSTYGRATGLLPFSLAELLLYLSAGVLLASLLYLLAKTIRKKAGWNNWKKFSLNLLTAAASLFLLYTLCCGINYGRTSFSETAGLENVSYTAEELAAVCKILAEKTNELSEKMTRAEDCTALMDSSINEQAQSAMEHLGTLYPELSGYYPHPKGLTFPAFLSIQNLSGIYSPFTIEANYNSAMTEYNLPFTACHELSHLRGFMQEEEANFIAWLACINSEEATFQYSGYLMGWLYASNQLYKIDYDAYRNTYDSLSPDVRADLNANNQFWEQYEGQIAEVSNQINDSYLKANGQTDGVQSYDRMVDLIMSHYWNYISNTEKEPMQK